MKHIRLMLVIMIVTALGISSTVYAQETEDMYTVGIWSLVGMDVFMDEMTSLGYIEGENITYIYAEDGVDDLDTAQVLVNAEVDAIVTFVDPYALQLMELTSTIPIVFALSDDPILTGVVESLTRPGTNVTGVMTVSPHEHKLQLLTEIDPTTEKVYLLYVPTYPGIEDLLEGITELADELEIEVDAVAVGDLEEEIEAVENAPEDVDWFFMTPFLTRDPEFYEALDVAATSRQAGLAEVLPDASKYAVMGYGPSTTEAVRQSAGIVDRILRGADPATLPVQAADNFLMVNLAAAENIGLAIPRGILRQADFIYRASDFEEED